MAGLDSYLRYLLFNCPYLSVLLLDCEAILACVAPVDINPIRVGLASTLKVTQFTFVQRSVPSRGLERRISPKPEQLDWAYSCDESLAYVLPSVASGDCGIGEFAEGAW